MVSVGPIDLAESLTNDSVVKKLQEAWQGNQELSLETVKLFNDPFQLGKISGVLAEEQLIQALVDEMAEEVTWTRRQTDFLELNQSCDLISISSPRLMRFYEFLKTDMITWMRQLTGLNLTHASANCSMYNHGDHLLVHDDCISDRKIAFVFYLSPWEEQKSWTQEMGGALELFSVDEGEKEPKFPTVQRIPPENNQMVFFRVCDKSFHQVGEVLTMDYPRLTINGWFHGPGDEFEAQVKESALIGRLKAANGVEFNLGEWINETYLLQKNMASIQGEIEDESQISLREFLIPDFAELIVQELASKELRWERSYSACERNYENLIWDSAGGPLKDLRNLFESQAFFRLMHQYTSLDFAGEHAKQPKCFVELQRWTNECYTMLVNESQENYIGNLLDVILYLNAGNEETAGGGSVGTFVYVNQGDNERDGEDEDDEGNASGSEVDHHSEKDDVLLTVEPQVNSLNIVYCTAGTSRFGKYVSRAVDMKGAFVYILSCTFKE